MAAAEGQDLEGLVQRAEAAGERDELMRRARDEHGGGMDVVLEMSGAEAAYNDAGTLVKNGGQILLLGIPSRPLRSFDFGKYAVWKGVTIRGIFGRRMFETWYAMSVLLEGGLDLAPVITGRYSYRDFEAAFEDAAGGKGGKVILDWTA